MRRAKPGVPDSPRFAHIQLAMIVSPALPNTHGKLMSETVQYEPSRLPDQGQLQSLAAAALAEAKSQDATDAEATVSFGKALSTTVRLGEVETLEFHRNRGLAVTVYFGHCSGSASTSDWQADALRDTVQAACAIARHTSADPCAGLADPARLAREIPDLDLEHPWELSAEEAILIAKGCEAAALGYDKRIRNSEGGSLSSHRGEVFYANSNGFSGGYATSRHSLSCSVIAQDDGGMQRDYWYTVARNPLDLEPAEAVGRQAAVRALGRLASRRLSTRQAAVLFTPEMARSLIGHFVAAIRGGALYRKASFLVDCLGKQIFPSHLTFREEPHLVRGLGSAPFDNEGVATVPRDLVRDGVLKGYVLDSYSARRLGMETTGNAGGVHNVIVGSDSLGFEALLRRLDTGLMVTHLMGQGINLVTGDYSRGAAGFWVEGGEIQYPVEEITIAGNLAQMFRGIVAIANDVDARGNIRCGSVLLECLTVAGD
jgi:PmbA protein